MSHTCTLYLVRHGETEWNVEHRIQGQLDSTLTENGIAEIKNLAEKLRTVTFDAIYSSDLLRTKHTAEILKLDRELTIITKEALRERTFGKYDGYYGKDYQDVIKELLQEYERLSTEDRWKFKFDDRYESDEILVSRFITMLREIAIAHQKETVLVVTHGGNLRTFLTHLGYAPHGELKPGTIKNGGYVKITSDGIDFFIEEVEGVDKNTGIARAKTM